MTDGEYETASESSSSPSEAGQRSKWGWVNGALFVALIVALIGAVTGSVGYFFIGKRDCQKEREILATTIKALSGELKRREDAYYSAIANAHSIYDMRQALSLRDTNAPFFDSAFKERGLRALQAELDQKLEKTNLAHQTFGVPLDNAAEAVLHINDRVRPVEELTKDQITESDITILNQKAKRALRRSNVKHYVIKASVVNADCSFWSVAARELGIIDKEDTVIFKIPN